MTTRAPTLSSAETAILGLLAEQPRHGYEIEQVIAERGMRDWTEIGFSSIYYVLGRLEHAGLATATTTPAAGRGPARRVHAPTAAGYEALRAATLAALGTPAPVARPLLLALANLPLIAWRPSVSSTHARRALRSSSTPSSTTASVRSKQKSPG